MEGEDQETTPAEKGDASPNEEQEERKKQEADEEDEEEERVGNNKKPQKHSSRRRKDKANKHNEAEDKDNGTNTEQSLAVLSEEEISKLDAAALECDIGMPAILTIEDTSLSSTLLQRCPRNRIEQDEAKPNGHPGV